MMNLILLALAIALAALARFAIVRRTVRRSGPGSLGARIARLHRGPGCAPNEHPIITPYRAPRLDHENRAGFQ